MQDSFLKSKCTSEIKLGVAETWFFFFDNANFVSVFIALNNTKTQWKFNITPYGKKFY